MILRDKLLISKVVLSQTTSMPASSRHVILLSLMASSRDGKNQYNFSVLVIINPEAMFIF
jgi:hypothetical protein